MKLSSVTILVALSALFAACSSLDNPFAGWFHSHSDARVYNPQTGQWEWPNQKTTPKPQKSAAVAAALNSTPSPQGSSDGRYFDAQKNEWVEVRNAPGHSEKPKAAPTPSADAPTGFVAPIPTAPRPPRETGVYNSSTGRIEWQASSETAPHGLPEPPLKTHWYWPFASEPKPKPQATPKPAAAPEAAPAKHWWWPFSSEAKPEPQAAAAPKPPITPKPVATPKPTPTPKPAVTPKPQITPQPAASPETASTKHWWWPFGSEAKPEVQATPKPVTTAKPPVTPKPQATPKPAVTLEATSTTHWWWPFSGGESKPAPQATPKPAATPEAPPVKHWWWPF